MASDPRVDEGDGPNNTKGSWNIIKSGFFAASVARILTQPFEVIRLKRQIDIGQYNTDWNCYNTILQQEGPLALFKGGYVAAIRLIPFLCSRFLLTELLRDLSGIVLGNRAASIKGMTCSIFAAMISQAIAMPLDYLKTRYVLQKERNLKGVIPATLTLLNSSSSNISAIKTFYSGFIADQAMVAISELISYMGRNTFEQLTAKNPTAKSFFTEHFFTGMVIVPIAQTVVYPLSTVLRCMQADATLPNHFTSVWQCVDIIYKKEGISGFYKGLGISLLRTIPYTIIQYALCELCQWCYKRQETNPNDFRAKFFLISVEILTVGSCVLLLY